MIIVGLGNPGKKYETTHHNVGFMAIDKIAEHLGVKFNKKGCQAEYGFTSVNGEMIVLAKPQTFMNLSGQAVKSLMANFKEDSKNVLIIYDDIELPLGALRVRKEGSGGTHNGMKNIVQSIGTEDFSRIRIGLGGLKHENQDLKDFVLQRFSKEQLEKLDIVFENVEDKLKEFLKVKSISN